MPNRIEARSAKAALTNATGRLPLLRLFSTPLLRLLAYRQRRLRRACAEGMIVATAVAGLLPIMGGQGAREEPKPLAASALWVERSGPGFRSRS